MYRWLTNTWKDAKHCSLLEKCKSKLQWDITAHQSESVQWLSHVQLFVTPWTAACHMSIKLVMPSNRLILCCPLLLLSAVFPSIRIFSSESVLCIKWPKYWSFSFSISPSNEYLGLMSFRIDWLDLLAVQGTLKSLLQHSSSKAWILHHSAFFMVQLLHPYMTTRNIRMAIIKKSQNS